MKIVINTGVCIVHSASNNFALALESANCNITDNYIFNFSNEITRLYTNSPENSEYIELIMIKNYILMYCLQGSL